MDCMLGVELQSRSRINSLPTSQFNTGVVNASQGIYLYFSLYSRPDANSDSFESQIVNSSPSGPPTTIRSKNMTIDMDLSSQSTYWGLSFSQSCSGPCEIQIYQYEPSLYMSTPRLTLFPGPKSIFLRLPIYSREYRDHSNRQHTPTPWGQQGGWTSEYMTMVVCVGR